MVGKKYWMVHVETAGSPQRKHINLLSAQQEAKRLAEQQPGVTVYVLVAWMAYCAKKPKAKQIKIKE